MGRSSSAVALLGTSGSERHVIGVAPCYTGFIGLADALQVEWIKPPGGAPDVAQLLATAKCLAGAPVDVVAIDMPMSTNMIGGYRIADCKLSTAFGAMQVSTHTPSVDRPGSLGKRMTTEFAQAGFHLATVKNRPMPSLVEVFPLAGLVRLMSLSKRPAYKAAKTSRYWPDLSLPRRMSRLIDNWIAIEAALRLEIGNLGFELPQSAPSLASLKPYEDALDAVICAWIGACFAEGKAEPFGDDEAAIWVPFARFGNNESLPPAT